jgi:HEAT repeat protein
MIWAVASAALSGCTRTKPRGVTAADFADYRELATSTIRAGLTYRDNAAVRVGAIEAMESIPDETKLPWLRSSLLDDHPGVRFAACVALGKARDAVSAKAIGRLTDDPNANVRVASYFARHRLGDTSMTGKLATHLLEDEDAGVRRNAAMVLGLLEEPGSVAILARAISDEDPGVRAHALEAMARLGNAEAKQELTFQANSGVGGEETLAVCALAGTRDRRYIDTYRYKLVNGVHLETRLAAARGLGLLGGDDGFEIAMKAIGSNSRRIRDRDDPEASQILRARQLGASALGAIGRMDALAKLASLLRDSRDPRVQVSFARAILDILASRRARALPFSTSADAGATSQR